jgi:hypothetical protein
MLTRLAENSSLFGPRSRVRPIFIADQRGRRLES